MTVIQNVQADVAIAVYMGVNGCWGNEDNFRGL